MSNRNVRTFNHLDTGCSINRETKADVVRIRAAANLSAREQIRIPGLSELRECTARVLDTQIAADRDGWVVLVTFGVIVDFYNNRSQTQSVMRLIFFKQRIPFPPGDDCKEITPLANASNVSWKAVISPDCDGSILNVKVRFRLTIFCAQHEAVTIQTNPNPTAFLPTSRPFGKTYAEWVAAWSRRMLSIAKPDNPILDPSKEKCTARSGRVRFLAGPLSGPVKGTCKIPAGEAIFFPIIYAVCDNLRPASPPPSPSELAASAASFIDGVTEKSVTVDGVTLKCLDLYRVQSPRFALTLPRDNILGVEVAGDETRRGSAVVDGYWIMLKPLPPGEHTISFRAKAVIPETGLSYETDVTYRVRVRPA